MCMTLRRYDSNRGSSDENPTCGTPSTSDLLDAEIARRSRCGHDAADRTLTARHPARRRPRKPLDYPQCNIDCTRTITHSSK